jgi:hypothetical protein
MVASEPGVKPNKNRARTISDVMQTRLMLPSRTNPSKSWSLRYEPFMRTLVLESFTVDQFETSYPWALMLRALEAAGVPDGERDAFLEHLQETQVMFRSDASTYCFTNPLFAHLTLAKAWLFGLRTPKKPSADLLQSQLEDYVLTHWMRPHALGALAWTLSIADQYGAKLAPAIKALLSAWQPGLPSASRTALRLVGASGIQDTSLVYILLDTAKADLVGRHLVVHDPLCPPQLLAAMAKAYRDQDYDDKVRLGIAQHPETPAAQLKELLSFKGVGSTIPKAAAGNPNLPVKTVLKYLEQRRWHWNDVRRELLARPDVPVLTLRKMAAENNGGSTHNGIVQNIHTPLDVLYDLMRKYSHVQFLAMNNPSIPAEKLEEYADSEQQIVRAGVARNQKTSTTTLERLSRDDWFYVRQGVASNQNAPVEILVSLARDESEDVRSQVACHECTPIQVLTELARDAQIRPRSSVTENRMTPVELLLELARDESEHVRGGVARNETAPLEVLDQLARDASAFVRKNVAVNVNTPVSLVNLLAQDQEDAVRWGAAKNLNLIFETHPAYPHVAKSGFEV